MDGWTDGRTDGVLFEAQKTMFFGNISKNKKYFLGEDIKEKESNWDPIGGPLRVHLRGIKLLSLQGESENQVNKKKETQGDPTS